MAWRRTGVVAGPAIEHEGQDRPYWETGRKVKVLPSPRGASQGGGCACVKVPSVPQAEPRGQCTRKDANGWWRPEATGVDPGAITDPGRALAFLGVRRDVANFPGPAAL